MEKRNKIVLGGGCFWCAEAVFALQKGVISATCGYAGGETPNPTYEQVSNGETGHAEVVEIEYDPSIASLSAILKTFFAMHDPTSLNRQGNDVGTQYRSAIYWTDEEQKKEIENYLTMLKSEYTQPIVTEVKLLDKFYKAEEYHQRFFEKNPNQAYCQAVIAPKVENFKKSL
ncbi:peptide-methionine (S)-S-oxide reductase MsrA [Patescibacteria group bacterium]|nr:peptide-methionine (S)-S-oxide reductase MsrA [Patescibacteria group bacterium]